MSDGAATATDKVSAVLVIDDTGNDLRETDKRISVFPNPARDYFFVDVQDLQVERVEMIDFNGKVLLQKNWEGHHRELFETDGIPPGVYILRLDTGKERLTGRVIIF